jgi:hypothetical protein
LSLAGEVNSLGQDAGCFLRSVETRRIFRQDKIEPPLCLAMQSLGFLECRFVHTGLASLPHSSD